MSYPRNAASPPIVAVGAIYLIADGTIQTTGASVRVKTGSGAWGAGAGTLACDTDSGIWTYVPTQGETNAESFIVAVYKASSTSQHQTVATSASATAGYAGLDWSKVTAATSAVALTNTTISTSQTITSVSGSVGSVTGNVGGNVVGSVGSVVAGVTVTANNDKTGYTLTVTPPTAATIADAVWDEAYSQHTTAGTFGKLMDILRKSNTVLEGTILASPTPTTTVFRLSGIDYPTGALEHAILWMNTGTSENQNSPILTTLNNGDGTVTVTLEESLVTAPVAGDTVLIDPTSHVHAIADIQGVMPDRLGYLLAILAGAISDAGTAAETYTITLGASTFTVDYSGLDAAGNRTGATLTKT
jgi:hypothetical protein